MPVVSLADLQQQITQRERELQALRQELETRQHELARLSSRKEELKAQLRQVEADIAALAASSPPRPAAAAMPTAAVPPTPAPAAPAQPRLADLIVGMLRPSGTAMTSRQLRDEALRRGYQSSSRNLVKTIEVRIQDLKRQGMVRKASGHAGYVLGPSAPGVKGDGDKKRHQPTPGETNKATAPAARPARPGSAAQKDSRPSATVPGTATAGGPAGSVSQPPLRQVLTTLLKKSPKLLTARELAAQALAGGYRTNSANFVKVVGTTLGEMGNVAYLPEQGYRLKKTKAKS
jgi:hypothetical protein